jgi:hypothetical protein
VADAWYIGFDLARTNSQSACRFTYGYDNDQGYNDLQQGFFCRYWDGMPRGQLRYLTAQGSRLMAR